MKSSYYNFPVKIGNTEILYNTISGRFIKSTTELTECINRGHSLDTKLLSELKNNYFLVDDDVNEKEMIKSIQMQKRYSPKAYLLILNTTLNCNLNCWYCYESHSKKAYMPIDMVQRILKHIELMHMSISYEILDLTFFGGEPMMNYKAVSNLIRGITELSQVRGFKISLTFVTNGTFISEKYINLLKPFNTRFQITIDGNKDSHNSIRKFKNENKQDSYSHIIEGLKQLNDADANFKFTLRINYDDKVLNHIEELINDLSFLKRSKCVIALQKVWQSDAAKIDVNRLFNIIEVINNAGFCLNTYRFKNTFCSCNTDNLNQAIINYDGKIFKCTARDFTDKESHGYLNELGVIEWNTEKMKERLAVNLPQKCHECKFLPCCPGICSQKIIENTEGKDIGCPFPFEKGITQEDIVLLNIKQQLIARKYEDS